MRAAILAAFVAFAAALAVVAGSTSAAPAIERAQPVAATVPAVSSPAPGFVAASEPRTDPPPVTAVPPPPAPAPTPVPAVFTPTPRPVMPPGFVVYARSGTADHAYAAPDWSSRYYACTNNGSDGYVILGGVPWLHTACGWVPTSAQPK